jgi:DNA (cytosine-5)-methyltransferase 1
VPFNHIAPRLSALDLAIVSHVPPGGNWKNIPDSVPSQRLEQIRSSYAAGEGSRSTYYGRLRPDAPAYTINTYFSRPGNGCHIHYDQDRVLTAREAARLQSFPDSFEFFGSQSAIATQIGNAVPPLLAYQVAREIGDPGAFVDLFAGAGGISLGFTWAGWKPLVASDIEPNFLRTYAHNIHDRVIAGDLRDEAVFSRVVADTLQAKDDAGDLPLWVLGGPPCQGFSTAGNRRSMDDERNHLFHNYRAFLDAIQPDGFVFENVSGLLNMEGGRMFELIRSTLEGAVDHLAIWHLHAERHAVPQRRSRVMLVGWKGSRTISPPPSRTADPRAHGEGQVAPWVSVAEAIDDLPAVVPGEDGSMRAYRWEPRTPFQQLVRGFMGPEEYLSIRAHVTGALIPILDPSPGRG